MNKEGIKIKDIMIKVVRKKNGEGNEVMKERKESRDLVIEKMKEEVMRWEEKEYKYMKRKEEKNKGSWVKIEEKENIMVG